MSTLLSRLSFAAALLMASPTLALANKIIGNG
jgi:hypothetical protein